MAGPVRREGFAVQPDSAPWSWGLELASWGPEGQEVAVSGAASMHAKVNRMEYRRPAGNGENLMLRVRGGLVAGGCRRG
ncbi:MAG: hypothetical protein NTV52_10390 [Acidobacteria bacterium]|nr:hypothetical protein [Acidobacteriota bacterium]